ncbi:MAG: ZIP family metal transporter, partial [Raoultibacter sp.]
MQQALLWAAAGTGFTFLMTTLGAASVFFFRKKDSRFAQRLFLGFAAGVMIAASVWSLLIPAIDQAEAAGQAGWIPAAGGFALGVVFLMGLHALLPHLHPGEKDAEGLPS